MSKMNIFKSNMAAKNMMLHLISDSKQKIKLDQWKRNEKWIIEIKDGHH